VETRVLGLPVGNVNAGHLLQIARSPRKNELAGPAVLNW
jgi:hypothetical protein